MSENLKTIKELADELGVSKATMFRFLRDNSFIETKMYKNQKVYDSYSVSQIKESFINSRTNSNSRTDSNFILYEQVKTQNKIISEQSKQISQMQNLLDQQQRLALQDKKLLEEYKAEIKDLKALKMPSQDTKEEQANSQPKEEVKALKSEIRALQEELNKQKIHSQEEREKLKAELTTPKKWYQFWK